MADAAHRKRKTSKKEPERLLAVRSRGATDRRRPLPETMVNLMTGQKVADKVAAMMGSWPFIIIQTTILIVWIVLNVTAYVQRWGPYPFILLNLALSFQAAYAAPFIIMGQNRQQDVDRAEAANDYRINIKAELEIESVHEKLICFAKGSCLNLPRPSNA